MRTPLKNKSRERMHAELRHLRTLAVDLERQRDELQERASASTSSFTRPPNEGWLDVIEHELEKRQQAEALNVHLRKQLDQLIQVMDGLKALIDHQVDTEDAFDPAHQHADDFSKFAEDISVGYRMVNSIIDAVDWSEDLSHQPWRIEIKPTEANGREQMVLELQKQYNNPSCEYVPGEGDTKSWEYVVLYFRSRSFDVEELVIQDNFVFIRYHGTFSVNGQEIPMYIEYMTKRFVEADRDVRMWRSRIMGEHERKVNRSVFVDGVGWQVVQPAEKGTTTRTCAHLVPRFEEMDEEDVSSRGKFPRLSDLVTYVLGSLQTESSDGNAELATL
ncbi:hypothetical protein Poli38472_004967 [Pythium oligandrum]|uniref:Uncharacterized protein n=1 Tax=Pythium oligandrum TaxID=41045 RepID=A0A8K1CBE5_PYTOL|nr:hypothetical protein Poli38472_004967 [Pythium oligandrum]|eukprot:TMW59898.1 hypothetical protein Poli38472_004967 [Pythium oligandrum]